MKRCIPVRELMSTTIFGARTDTPLKELSRMLREHKIRHIPILDGQGRIRGLVSHRDMLVAHVTSKGVEGQRIAGHIMSHDLTTVSPESCVGAAGRLILESKFSCLPVVDDDRVLVGILSESDFIRMALSDHDC